MNLHFSTRYLYLFVFTGGVILSCLASAYVYKSDEAQNRALFERAARRNFHTIESSFAWNLENLESIGSYFLSSRWVEKAEFNNFTGPLLKRNAGYEAISLIMEIPMDKSEQVKTLLRNEHIPLILPTDPSAYPLRILAYSNPQEQFDNLSGYNTVNNSALKTVLDQATQTRETAFLFGAPAPFGKKPECLPGNIACSPLHLSCCGYY